MAEGAEGWTMMELSEETSIQLPLDALTGAARRLHGVLNRFRWLVRFG